MDLARLAGLHPAGVICEVLDDEGGMARAARADRASPRVSPQVHHDQGPDRVPHPQGEAGPAGPRPPAADRATATSRSSPTRPRWTTASPGPGAWATSRTRSRCWCACTPSASPATSSAPSRCDCGSQLHKALDASSSTQGAASSSTCARKGAASACCNKLRAYELQDQGKDTVEANHALGFRADLRHYGIGAQILVDLGVRNLRSSPTTRRRSWASKATASRWWSGCRSRCPPTDANRSYLRTKREKLGHLFSSFPD